MLFRSRSAIRDHFMNRYWLDRQKSKANKAKFRDATSPRESPSEYYIRKLELLEFVYDYTDAELITEILDGAPVIWNTILNPHQFRTITDLQNAIRYYEETLSQLSGTRDMVPSTGRPQYSREYRDRSYRPRDREHAARSNLVQKSWGTPPYPKDDLVVSK